MNLISKLDNVDLRKLSDVDFHIVKSVLEKYLPKETNKGEF